MKSKNRQLSIPTIEGQIYFGWKRIRHRGDKNINAYREKEFKKWMTQGNHSYFSAIIISDKTDDKYEKITLTIRFPRQVITKHYKLLSKDQ